jgi:hypothetical protein
VNAVSPDKAGAASGILSMFRMVGGTFGVAAIGALFQSLARTRIDERLSGVLPPGTRSQLVDNIGSGAGSKMLNGMDPHRAAQVGSAMHDAFIHGLSGALTLSCAVAAVGAVLAFSLIERKPAHAPSVDPGRHPEAAEPIGV